MFSKGVQNFGQKFSLSYNAEYYQMQNDSKS